MESFSESLERLIAEYFRKADRYDLNAGVC